MFYTASRKQITVGAKLGGGGEGDVFAIANSPDEVAKIFHQHQATKDRHQKLAYMVANPPHDPCSQLIPPHVSIAWPTELLFADPGCVTFAGYVMPMVASAKKMAQAYHPPTRNREMPGFTWKYSMCAARNLASSVQALHDKGYVIGDLNESNIMVLSTGMITLIDTDSFQVNSGRTCCRCSVGKPEFTAPESQSKNFSTFDRSNSDDSFALSVMVFLLLMEGRHPFDGIARRVPDLVDTGDRIRDNWYQEAHVRRKGVIDPQAKSPDISMLHSDVLALFNRCFIDGEADPTKRPSPREWMTVLGKAMASLATCAVNPLHQYASNLSSCPWCQRMVSCQISDPFPSPTGKPSLKSAANRPVPAQVRLPPIAPVAAARPTAVPTQPRTWPTAIPAQRTKQSAFTTLLALVSCGLLVSAVGFWFLSRHSTANTPRVETSYKTAVDDLNHGDYNSATMAAKQYYSDNKESPVAIKLLAACYGCKGDFIDSATYYKQAVKLKPSDMEAHLGLGTEYDAAGDYSSARSQYKTVVESPDSTKDEVTQSTSRLKALSNR